MIVAAAVFAGFIADSIFGDPVYSFHPVRILGLIIQKGEKLLLRSGQGRITAFIAGAQLSLALIAVSFFIPYIALSLLHGVHIATRLILETAFCYQIFAAKALKDESMLVYRQLENGDIQQSRRYLSYIVGRDTQRLGEEEIVKAAVETVAENISDGVIAPLFYMLIGGAPLAFAYKAVNTLDSMIGYKNEKYAYFGKFAARLDDLVNFIPSRLSALFMLAASVLCKMNVRQALKIYLRDRYKHKSVNSAQTESICAGALGLSLSGDNYYGGVLVKKPAIGDPLRQAVKEDIILANKLMYTTVCIGLLIGVSIRIALCVL
jgi:adenosylcobinamide-phosphate synthase